MILATICGSSEYLQNVGPLRYERGSEASVTLLSFTLCCLQRYHIHAGKMSKEPKTFLSECVKPESIRVLRARNVTFTSCHIYKCEDPVRYKCRTGTPALPFFFTCRRLVTPVHGCPVANVHELNFFRLRKPLTLWGPCLAKHS